MGDKHSVADYLARAQQGSALCDSRLSAVSDTARLDIELLLCSCLGKERTFLFTWPEHKLDDSQQAQFEALYQRRLAGEPIAHLCGTRGFWDFDLLVNAHTLIPRPETELLVELALECLPQDQPLLVADLGTGTGAIALALAYERPQAKVWGTDRIEAAVTLAAENAAQLRLTNVEFAQGFWCEALPEQAFDLIVSNPPYIDAADPHLAQGDVRYEPLSALVAAEDGLKDIRLIAQAARSYLQDGAYLLFEHGFEQGEPVRALLQTLGYSDVQTQQDLAGLDRVTQARYRK